jgi:hypothetical protein
MTTPVSLTVAVPVGALDDRMALADGGLYPAVFSPTY